MESNQDSAALAKQIQALAATAKELTKQNQEMKQWLQQEENQSKGNLEDEGDSHRRSDHRRPTTLDEQSSDLLREMRKEIDELRNAIKGKTDRSLDRMVGQWTHPSLQQSWSVRYRQNFDYPNLNHLTGLKTPRITSTPLKQC